LPAAASPSLLLALDEKIGHPVDAFLASMEIAFV
jgi:hypothetical protein